MELELEWELNWRLEWEMELQPYKPRELQPDPAQLSVLGQNIYTVIVEQVHPSIIILITEIQPNVLVELGANR